MYIYIYKSRILFGCFSRTLPPSKENHGSHSGLCKGAAGGQWCLCTSPACQGLRRDGDSWVDLNWRKSLDISGKSQNVSK